MTTINFLLRPFASFRLRYGYDGQAVLKNNHVKK